MLLIKDDLCDGGPQHTRVSAAHHDEYGGSEGKRTAADLAITMAIGQISRPIRQMGRPMQERQERHGGAVADGDTTAEQPAETAIGHQSKQLARLTNLDVRPLTRREQRASPLEVGVPSINGRLLCREDERRCSCPPAPREREPHAQ